MRSVASQRPRGETRLGRRLTRLAGAALVLVLVAVAAVVGVRWWQDGHRSELEHAVGLAPASSLRYSWTDWSAVRAELGSSVDADSSARALDDFLSEGYDADLVSGSAMGESATVLQRDYGLSPADVDWELLAQSESGSVLFLGLPEDLDVDDLADTFEGLGYSRPDDADGVWNGGEELVAQLAAAAASSLSPQFQHLAINADERVVLASDNAAYLRDAAAELESRVDDEGLRDAVRAVGDPLSAAVYTGDFACRSLAMAQADESDQTTADELIARAGDVDPLAGFAMGVEDDGDVRVALSFETDEQARTNADSRAALAAGPAPGQGGDFTDRFTLGPVTADGRVVTLELDPRDGDPVLSDLSTGPVLFATC